MRAILSHSLIVACYALIDSSDKAYSFHHALKDAELVVTSKAKSEYHACVDVRSKIATYRNNVSAHVNARRSKQTWADYADIRNSELDNFIRNARLVLMELGKSNIDQNFMASSYIPFKSNFRQFWEIMSIKEDR